MADDNKDKPPSDDARRYDSRGTLRAGGKTLNYRATAAWLTLFDGDRRKATVFHTYYRLAQRGGRRPITFVFNGGPGAASAYLHVGAVGPRRVACGREGGLLPAPAKLVDNAESWLPFTDLVFVDPVGTGLSRTLPGNEDKDAKSGKEQPEDTFYWDVDKDLSSLCEFIGQFLSREGRWSAPIHVAGESYGGYRVARLVRTLQEKSGIGLSGAVLISPVLEWDAIFSSRFNALAAVMRLPSYAASARRHGRCAAARGGETLEAFLARAEEFALTEYLPAVAAPGALDGKFLDRLVSWTGLDRDRLRRQSGMPGIEQFVRDLLRDEGKVLGRYDAGVWIDDPFPFTDSYRGVDVTLDGLNRVYTVAANQHLRDRLGVDSERRYELLSYDVNRKWQWRDAHSGSPVPPGAAEDLAVGLSMSPEMRLAVVHGAYDLITPYFDSKYLLQQLRRGSPLSESVAMHVYEGGHMFYMWERSRRQFTRDVRALYD